MVINEDLQASWVPRTQKETGINQNEEQESAKHEKSYRREQGKYFGFYFTDGTIEIRGLPFSIIASIQPATTIVQTI